jgi:hypothetical protein
MANWQTTLDISDVYDHDKNDGATCSVVKAGRIVANRLEENKFASDSDIQDIIMRLQEVEDDADEFDEIMDDLYEFADKEHRIWVKTF